jgi:hypothetical protein
LSDGIKARRFPIVTVAIIAVNFAVWLLYELPHLGVHRLRSRVHLAAEAR